jgi:Flp pilus assembly protein TadD
MTMAIERSAEGAPQPSMDQLGRMLAEGAFRKELGLEAKDLRVGLNVAKNLLDRGQASEALRIYVALVLCNPTDVDFQIGLANCALRLEEPHLALQSASAVIALKPDEPRGYFLSGSACLMLGNFDEAAEDFRDAVRFGRDARDHKVVDLANAGLGRVEVLAASRKAAE